MEINRRLQLLSPPPILTLPHTYNNYTQTLIPNFSVKKSHEITHLHFPMDPDLLPSNFPLVLFDRHSMVNDKCRYRIMCPIGAFAGGQYKVYKAAVINPSRAYYHNLNVEDIFVTLKFVNAGTDRKGYGELRREAELNNLMPAYENIIRIERPFFSPSDDYCVVFPHMGMGSMRYILRTKFPDGMPEDLLLVVLKETLKGLNSLHRCDRVHGQLNAGNIFLSREPSIKISFSATLFTPTEDQNLSASTSPSLPISEICTWAAAPEAYNEHPCRYTAKADVWMIGITALELACGGLQEVPDRETLENIVKDIIRRRKFPKEEKANKKTKYLRIVKPSGSGGSRQPVYVFTKRAFSRKFQEMVATCLEWDHRSRPIVEQLLHTDIMMENLDRQAMYFYGMMIDVPVRGGY